ncbi:DUF7344 domain-containing protein [Natronococcus jeotgali]|uniref:DUF7344 domain-containing protein n=1 Tax=Natronococcus jeotgali DSM 18795 TaxID=1227498 RepID=L9XW07_9EURY|nr:hypothetical protein [Natronococcus jeotgali]ELY65950.1 hypothetical protein C492_02052 [Natronococcus jeotgali DSM 18795]
MSRTDANDGLPSGTWRLLADPRRRYLLESLQPGAPTTLSALAEEIAARERGEPAGTIDRTVRRRIEIALVHNHLPRLADRGVIAYDPTTDRVVLTADRETRRLLEASLR